MGTSTLKRNTAKLTSEKAVATVTRRWKAWKKPLSFNHALVSVATNLARIIRVGRQQGRGELP